MFQPTTKNPRTPLRLDHLPLSQSVFDDIQQHAEFALNAEESERVSAIILDLYRQGIDDPVELESMVRMARGLI